MMCRDLNQINSAQDMMNGNKLPSSIKVGEFLNEPRKYQFLTKGYVLWTWLLYVISESTNPCKLLHYTQHVLCVLSLSGRQLLWSFAVWTYVSNFCPHVSHTEIKSSDRIWWNAYFTRTCHIPIHIQRKLYFLLLSFSWQ